MNLELFREKWVCLNLSIYEEKCKYSWVLKLEVYLVM